MLRLYNFSIVSVINFKLSLPNRQVERNEQQLESYALSKENIVFVSKNDLFEFMIQN
jgi:hypothetical protein